MQIIRKNPLIAINIETGEVILDPNQIYVFDFDKTLYTASSSSSDIEDYINDKVILKMMLKAVKNFNREAITYLETITGNSIGDILYNAEFDKNYRRKIGELIGNDFDKKAAPNHRISYLTHFGYKENEIYKKYAKIKNFAAVFYKDIENHPIMKKIFLKALEQGIAVGYTDNSKENFIEGMSMLGYDKEKLNNMPILSMFKAVDSDKIDTISTKKQDKAAEYICYAISNSLGCRIYPENITMFDDNQSIINNLSKSGINTILVRDLELLPTEPIKTDFLSPVLSKPDFNFEEIIKTHPCTSLTQKKPQDTIFPSVLKLEDTSEKIEISQQPQKQKFFARRHVNPEKFSVIGMQMK